MQIFGLLGQASRARNTGAGRSVSQPSDLGTQEGSFWQAEFSRVFGRDFLQVLWTVDFIAHFLGWATVPR